MMLIRTSLIYVGNNYSLISSVNSIRLPLLLTTEVPQNTYTLCKDASQSIDSDIDQ